MKTCTGKNCPMQTGKVVPAVCEAYENCPWVTKPTTHADRIRAMTDEELAEFLAKRTTAPLCTRSCHNDFENYGEIRTFCDDCWLTWLKQEEADAKLD